VDRIRVDDAEIAYEVRGEGEPVLLIPLSVISMAWRIPVPPGGARWGLPADPLPPTRLGGERAGRRTV
jgi:hypothetical protein